MFDKLNHIVPDLLLTKKFRWLRHLLIQLIVFLITMNIFWDEPNTILYERFGVWVIYFLLINLVIYINIYLLVPHLLLKGKVVAYLFSIPALMLLAAFIIAMLQQMSGADDNTSYSSFIHNIFATLSTISGFTLFIAGITAFLLLKNRLKNMRKITALEKTTMALELDNLQKQINPHFLFNMVNNANILAQEDVEKSSYILSKLNDLLRYQIEGSAKEIVSLFNEINFINDYLELEKIRRDRFTFSVSHNIRSDITLPPLLFITFVENAVKHNPENDAYVNVIFIQEENDLYFECKNSKPKDIVRKEEGGIGLVNIKKRLDLLFGENHQLDITDDADSYTVKLKFSINKMKTYQQF